MGTLLHAWFAEANSGDWSLFAASDNTLILQGLLLSGVAMALTGSPMTPRNRRFANYGKQMRNSMVSAAVQAWVVSSTVLHAHGNFPAILEAPTEMLALVSMGLLGWDAILE